MHRSDRERHGLLGLEDLNTAVSHGGCKDAVESRSNRQTCVTFDGDVHVRIFFAC